MPGISSERAAQIGIGIQFLALIRTLSEYFRLEHFGPQPFTLAMAEPYVTGALIASICTAGSVTLYFLRRFKAATLIAAATIVILFVYKLVALR